MSDKYKLECVKCGKKDGFEDTKAITFAHWIILGWNMSNNIPVCTCDKCNYEVADDKSKKREKI